MITTMKFFIIILAVVIILVSACTLIAAKVKYDREKYSVFECGFDLLSALRLPFSLNFYFITIIFLIFDVELVLILPFAFNTGILPVTNTMILMIMFFMILIVGFLYEWMVGLLNWLV